MSIKDKLQSISDTKLASKQVLKNKGIPPGDRFSDYTGKLNELVTVDGLNGNTVSNIIPSKTDKIITPGSTDQTIAAEQYLAGNQTIEGDVNLTPENIKKETSVLG